LISSVFYAVYAGTEAAVCAGEAVRVAFELFAFGLEEIAHL
jgi:hypothetical protein